MMMMMMMTTTMMMMIPSRLHIYLLSVSVNSEPSIFGNVVFPVLMFVVSCFF